MNYTQLTAYLQAYLQTNDAQVIDNIPNFLSIAAARMATDIRNSLIEQQVWLDAIQAQPLPLGFVAVRLMTSNGVPLDWITPKQYAEGGQGFTIQAQQILISPIPETTDSIQLTYYVINLNNALANNIPHILLHCAAAEAEMFQGDLEAAVSEMQLYKGDTDSSNGWDFQGSISLGGLSASSEAASALSSGGSGSNAQPRAGNVSFEPAGTLQSTNVQAALQELDSDQIAHTFNTSNPHLTTAVQVGAVPMVSASVVGNVLTADGSAWISAAPQGGGGGGATWGTITGSLNSQADLVAELALHTTDTEFNAHLTGAAAHTAANVGAIPMVAPGSAGNVLTSQGGAWVSATPSSPKVARSGVQVLSAAFHDFSLPVNCTSFSLSFSDLSVSTTTMPTLQLSTSGGSVVTGYLGNGSSIQASAAATTAATNGCPITSAVTAAAVYNGTFEGRLINAATNLWQITFTGARTDTVQTAIASTRLALASAATGLRFNANSGAFDGGSASCITTVP